MNFQRPLTQYTTSGDVHIAYQVVGDGPVDLLYAQGWVSNVEYAWENPDYARFLSRLGQTFRLIWFDKRGTGMSDREFGASTLAERMEDITAVLDAVGSERAAVYGLSEGGIMASLFAATYPERVSHLLLFGSSPRRAWAPDYPWGITEEEFEEEVEAMMRDWGKPFDLENAAPSLVGERAAEEWFAAYLRYSASPSGVVAHSRWQYGTDIRHVLPTIRVPALVLQREGDRWCNVEVGRLVASMIPGAEFRLLPGSDHLPWSGDQERLVREIEEFVLGASSTASAERVLATLLMVDVEESTDRLSAIGDARWNALIDGLRDKLQKRALAHGGTLVDATGDGSLMSFPGPTRAVECAQALIRDAEGLGVGLRAGIHTGEVDRQGSGLGGVGVHTVARIMDAAVGGEILASGTVRDLSSGAGLDFSSRGFFQLKGLDGSRELFLVT